MHKTGHAVPGRQSEHTVNRRVRGKLDQLASGYAQIDIALFHGIPNVVAKLVVKCEGLLRRGAGGRLMRDAC